MIGYYVHHVGHGHLHRATAFAHEWGEPVTGLSSLARPHDWPGPWIELARDDEAELPHDVTAGGRLHWVPERDPGLLSRTSEICSWLRHLEPDAMVVDVSVEVATLVRLHGVPVVSVVGPGERDDPAHLLGLGVAHTVVAFWPPGMTDVLLPGLPSEIRARVHAVGGLSRYPVVADDEGGRDGRTGPGGAGRGSDRRRRVVLMMGAGGDDLGPGAVEAARAATPDWEWTVIGGASGEWVDDPLPVLRSADVVVTHAGQNALAEVAAVRRPAVVVPQKRPHHEQHVTAAALAAGEWPVVVEDAFPVAGWPERLEQVAALDGTSWRAWCDGGAPARFAAVVRRVAAGERA